MEPPLITLSRSAPHPSPQGNGTPSVRHCNYAYSSTAHNILSDIKGRRLTFGFIDCGLRETRGESSVIVNGAVSPFVRS